MRSSVAGEADAKLVWQQKMTTTSAKLTSEEKSYLLNDAVFYEAIFALGVSTHDATDYCVWEHLNFSRMGHARALFYFFESPSEQKRWPDDVVSEDFGFPAAAILITKDDRDRFNKDLFHLSARRVRHTVDSKPWPNSFLQCIHERAISFTDHILSKQAVRDFQVDLRKWEALSKVLKEGKEILISRCFRHDEGDTGWQLELGRVLPSGRSELTELHRK